ncbi:MAG TPA: hypothetical protein VFL66_12530 [Gaiellaceae bacterium]|nr:hypothetical protein [Gaiellaceae bacterium]
MIALPPVFSDRRYVHALDVLALVWVCLWIGIGWLVYHYVNGLASLSDTVVLAGKAVDATASALDAIAQVPFVGGQLHELVQSAHQAAASAVSSGRSSRHDVHTLAVLLWLAIAAAPTTPLLVLYGLLRRGWRRDVASMRQLAAGFDDDEALQRFLARRAVEHMPYRRLHRISDNPWRDLEEGRTEALARAELERMGLRRRDDPS